MATSASESGGRSPVVTGLFRDRGSAERAYNSLARRGYSRESINVAMSDETRPRCSPEGKDSADLDGKALEGVGAGSAIVGKDVGERVETVRQTQRRTDVRGRAAGAGSRAVPRPRPMTGTDPPATETFF